MTIDSSTREAYAVAFARENYDWAEVKIVLRNLIRHPEWKDHIYNVDLIVRCSVSRTFDHVYGVKFALDASVVPVEFNEIAAVHKVMSAIDKRLKKMGQELGYVPDGNFAEFARRVLHASGIRHVLYERTFNQGNRDRNGDQLKDGIFGLPCVDPRDGKDFLAIINNLVEDTLAKKGGKKEAA